MVVRRKYAYVHCLSFIASVHVSLQLKRSSSGDVGDSMLSQTPLHLLLIRCKLYCKDPYEQQMVLPKLDLVWLDRERFS